MWTYNKIGEMFAKTWITEKEPTVTYGWFLGRNDQTDHSVQWMLDEDEGILKINGTTAESRIPMFAEILLGERSKTLEFGCFDTVIIDNVKILEFGCFNTNAFRGKKIVLKNVSHIKGHALQGVKVEFEWGDQPIEFDIGALEGCEIL